MIEPIGRDEASQNDVVGAVRSSPEREITVRNIAIATMCMIGVAFGVLMFGVVLGVSAAPMTSEFHWTRTQFSWAMSAMTWSGAFVAPFIGRVIDRLGVKPIVTVGTLITGLTAIAISRQGANLLTFYAAFALLGLCAPMAIGYSKVIASLFKRNRGKMLALFSVETSVVGAAVPLAIGQIYIHYGWRTLYVCIGVATLALLPLIYWLLEEPGGGRAGGRGGATAAPAPTMAGLTLGQIVRTQPFWIIVAVAVLILGPLQGATPHVIPFLEQKGFSITVATTYASVAFLLGFLGSIYAGVMLDRFHTAKIAAPTYVALAIGWGGLLLATPMFGGLVLLYATSAFCGVAISSAMPMNTYFHTRFFGLRAFTEVMGVERAITALAAGVAAPAMGYVYDRTHSYHGVFAFMTIAPLVAATLFLVIGRYRYAADVGLASSPSVEHVNSPAVDQPAAVPAE